jgi:hypothetical protein
MAPEKVNEIKFGERKNIKKCGILLHGLHGRGLLLKSFLLDVSPPFVCGISRSGLSGSEMNTLPRANACYIAVHRFIPTAVGDWLRDHSRRCRPQMATESREEMISSIEHRHQARPTKYHIITPAVKSYVNLSMLRENKKSRSFQLGNLCTTLPKTKFDLRTIVLSIHCSSQLSCRDPHIWFPSPRLISTGLRTYMPMPCSGECHVWKCSVIIIMSW